MCIILNQGFGGLGNDSTSVSAAALLRGSRARLPEKGPPSPVSTVETMGPWYRFLNNYLYQFGGSLLWL